MIDYFSIDRNNLIIVLGDVMGKKWAAWHFAIAYAGYIRSTIRSIIETSSNFLPSNIISKLNKLISQDNRISEVFISLSIVQLDCQNDLLKYCGAGDNPSFRINSTGQLVKIKSDGLLLGFSDKNQYSDTIIELNQLDKILLFTDGLIESKNINGQQFGEQGIIRAILSSYNSTNFFEKIISYFKNFTSNNYDDDVTLISIEKI